MLEAMHNYIISCTHASSLVLLDDGDALIIGFIYYN